MADKKRQRVSKYPVTSLVFEYLQVAQELVRDNWHDSGSPFVGYSVYGRYPTLDEADQALKVLQAVLQVMGS